MGLGNDMLSNMIAGWPIPQESSELQDCIRLMQDDDVIKFTKDDKVGYVAHFIQGDHVHISHIIGGDDTSMNKVDKKLYNFISNIRKRLIAQSNGQQSRGKQ